jgi:coronin-1B/1C/6
MTWSHDGGILAAVTKAKELSLVDPREATIMQTVTAHPGAKSQRCCWLGSQNLIFTFGFSKQSEREIAIWDPKNLAEPVYKDALDVSSGVMIPMYDPDLHMLYLGGKGDGNIQYFEIMADGKPFFLTSFQSNDPQAGLAMKPKRALNVMGSEVACIMKMTKTKVTPIHFTYPRKGENFDSELFPPSASASPSVSVEDWCGGSTAPPALMSLDPSGSGGPIAAAAPVKKSGMAGMVDDLKAEVAALKAQLAEKDAEIAALKAGAGSAAPTPEPAADDDDEPAE